MTSAETVGGGARFHRCALQVNPAHYAETYRGEEAQSDDDYVDAVLAKCVELGIDVLGITDHNHAGSTDLFAEKAKPMHIVVFPGFEVSSTEGIHVLCLYEPGTPQMELNRYLGELGIRDVNPSSLLSSLGFDGLLKCVSDQRGIAVAAHVTQKKGLLYALQGEACIRAWKDRNLLAVQIPGSVADTPQEKRSILQNGDAQYRRDPEAAPGQALAVINASDVRAAEDLQEAGATCWIKMSSISVEGLRQAFLDPGSRIRLASDPLPERHSEIVSVSWQGGFFDDVTIELSENLNVLVGGRGTGKSTLIESIRYAMGLDPVGSDAIASRKGLMKKVVGYGTRISIQLQSHQPSARRYTIERVVPDPPVVRDEEGQVLDLKPVDIAPTLQVYGQHEISELTRSPEKLTALLERFVGSTSAAEGHSRTIATQLGESKDELKRLQNRIEEIEEDLSKLPRLEEQLKRFDESGLSDKLKDSTQMAKEESVATEVYESLTATRTCFDTIDLESLLNGSAPAGLAEGGEGASEEFLAVNERVSKLKRDLSGVQSQVASVIVQAKGDIEELLKPWNARRAIAKTAHQEVLRELQNDGVDGTAFLDTTREVGRLRPLKSQLEDLREEESKVLGTRRTSLADKNNQGAAELRELQRAAKKVSKSLEDRVRVSVNVSSDREPMFSILRRIGGRLSEAVEALKVVEDLSMLDFVDCCREGAEKLKVKYNIPDAQARRFAAELTPHLPDIEEVQLPIETSIELNTAPYGQSHVWHKLDDLSTGQKATAVLLLLFLESDAPLIIDQPEDDLDNSFITESVIPRMREAKRKRQFIFATHNANIPVLGDAELIVGLSPAPDHEDGAARIGASAVGSIDDQGVRTLVERILEGGREAFQLRQRKYGF